MSDRYALGIDLGGTSLKYGICRYDGEIKKEFQRPSMAAKPVDDILRNIGDAIEEAIAYACEKGLEILTVGMGTPGGVDVKRGYLKGTTPNFKYWRDVPIKERLEARVNLPVFVDNDANVMAFGESMYGACKESSDNVCVTLGTGIGGGIIIGNEIYRGGNYCGSEIGHMSIRYDGIRCRCGGIGCWEKYASATAMIDTYNRLKPDAPVKSTVDIFKRYAENEIEAVEVVEQEIRLVAVGLASLINIFNPGMIVIGGGVGEAGDWFIERIGEIARSIVPASSVEGLKIVPAVLGNKAGWLGAAAFAMQEMKKLGK